MFYDSIQSITLHSVATELRLILADVFLNLSLLSCAFMILALFCVCPHHIFIF
jgi:hypothetical protein